MKGPIGPIAIAVATPLQPSPFIDEGVEIEVSQGGMLTFATKIPRGLT